MTDSIEWDEGNWPKCGQHGVSKAEIESVFENAPAVYPDPAHSAEEVRYLAIGRNDAGRHVFLAFTLRASPEGRKIRPISARYMHRQEIEHYERQRPKGSETEI